ncbi:MAG: flagellar filament capping protein FliD [Pseudomonadota bacterium]
MVGIVSTGIGSGLDVNGLVQQLVAAEGQPVQQRLIVRESEFQSQLSAFGSFRSALDALKTAAERLGDGEATSARSVVSSNEDAVTVTAEPAAVPATYTVAITNLATNERLTSGAFADSQAAVGTGNLTLSIGGESFTVAIDEGNNTLEGIRAAVNESTENTGVQATIINAEGASYLVFVGDDTGSDNTITVTQEGGDGGLSVLDYDPDNGVTSLTRSQAADNARAEVNGFSVESATNVFDTVIDAVSFTATEVTGSDTFEIAVSNDTSTVRGAVGTFVFAYNEFVDTAANLSAFDAETNVAGALQGDALLRNATALLRRELSNNTESAAAGADTLTEIGIALDEDGKLQIDNELLNPVLESNFRAITSLFGGDDGYVARLDTVIESFTRDDGLLQTRTDGIQSSIDALGEQNERLNARLEALETRLFRQFNGLDSLLSQLNLTSSFLATQLANLPTPGANR